MSDTSIFDRADLLKRLMGDEELIPELLEEFFNDIPKRLLELRQALDSKILDLSLRRVICYQSHTIKGAAASIGAPALRDAAHDLSWEGCAGELERLRELNFDVALEFDRLREYVGHERSADEAS